MKKELVHIIMNFAVAAFATIGVIWSWNIISFIFSYIWLLGYMIVCLFESAARSRAGNSEVVFVSLPIREVALGLVPIIFSAIGMTFAGLYMSVGGIVNTFTGQPASSWFEYTYYSFVTLTTVGYGEYIPIINGARLIVLLELTTGIVFLILFVGLVMSRVSSLNDKD